MIGKDYPNDDLIKKFIDYLNEVKDKLEENYNRSNNFKLKLYIKGNKNSSNLYYECIFIPIINNKQDEIFVERDIFINGISDAFYLLLNHLNNI